MQKLNGVLYWITGLAGAGKTTIGNSLYYELKKRQNNVVLLDGDILKMIVNENPGYSEADRRKRAMKYARLCKVLTDQDLTVICCTIAMFDEVREWNRKNNKGYVEVFLDVSEEILQKRDQKGMYSQYKMGKIVKVAGVDVKVELPKNPDLVLNNDGALTIKECVERILNVKVSFSNAYDRDVKYWNSFYENCRNIENPSLFAESVLREMEKDKNLLELGCGNGRDSLYFARNGLNVTAIDSSDAVIEKLQKTNIDNMNICFTCDDFVRSSAIFVGQYDYCYSRFSLHSINAEQESEVIRNVYEALKENGKFFIEVRSVNDEIYGMGKKAAENSYIYQGHFRRFIIKEELENKLEQAGFSIPYSEEKRGFAPFEGSDPPIIRIIAKKMERRRD